MSEQWPWGNKEEDGPIATNAMKDLIAFMSVAERVPEAADAYRECTEFGIPVLTCDLDRNGTAIAGKPVIHFKLEERLMRYLAAFRAGQGQQGQLNVVGELH